MKMCVGLVPSLQLKPEIRQILLCSGCKTMVGDDAYAYIEGSLAELLELGKYVVCLYCHRMTDAHERSRGYKCKWTRKVKALLREQKGSDAER